MELLRLLEGIRSPFLDALFSLITRLGDETLGVVVLCAVFWCISKRIAYMIGVTYFLSGLTVQGMKICFRVERPWIAYPTLNPLESALDRATGYSFPSGHTQSAAALFGSLGVHVKYRTIKAVCFLIVILVAFSRLYMGVHTLSDIVASLVISFIFILLSALVYKNDIYNKKRDLIISLAMALFAGAVIVIAAALYINGTIEEQYVSDCLKAAGAGVGFAAGMFIERAYIKFSVKTKNIFWQAVKLVLGIAGLLVIEEGLKLVIGTGLIVDMIRYFLMLSWVTVFYPLIIKRFFEPKEKNSAVKEANK